MGHRWGLDLGEDWEVEKGGGEQIPRGETIVFEEENHVWEPSLICVLLGGCIDDTILSRQGFINYSKLPSLALAQGSCGGPGSSSQPGPTLLQHHPLQLTALLDQYARQQHEGDPCQASQRSSRIFPTLFRDS